MGYVLDCSFCASLFLPDEDSEKTMAIFDAINEDNEVYIPQLWWYEMSNVLSLAIKHKRLTYADVLNINYLLSSFHFITDSNYGKNYSEKLLELTQLYGLSAYDASYLELSMRKQGTLGSLDKDLNNACLAAGVALV
jgi:predicted nucleic acid-binding protein